jgi:hypothetical protein
VLLIKKPGKFAIHSWIQFIDQVDGQNEYTVTLTNGQQGLLVLAEGRCKDPSTSDGWGPPQTLGQTNAVLGPIIVTTTGIAGSVSGSFVVQHVSTYARGTGCADTGTLSSTSSSFGYLAGGPIFELYLYAPTSGTDCGVIGSWVLRYKSSPTASSKFVASDTAGNLNPPGDFTNLSLDIAYSNAVGDPVVPAPVPEIPPLP